MLTPAYTGQFKKDVKRIKKQHKNTDNLKEIIIKLTNEETLPPSNRDHQLTGNYTRHRECHIEPDWLLIYMIRDQSIIFVRTGSHAELFS